MPSAAAARAHRLDLFLVGPERRQPLARRRDLLAIHDKFIGSPGSESRSGRHEMRADRAERRRRKFIVEPFVQRDHAEPGRHPQRKPVALDDRLPRVHRRGDMHRRRRRQPFRHGEHEDAAVGFREQAAFGDGPSRQQGRVEIEAAEQASIGNMQRQMS